MYDQVCKLLISTRTRFQKQLQLFILDINSWFLQKDVLKSLFKRLFFYQLWGTRVTYVRFSVLQALKTAKQIGALVYSEISSKDSQRSVNDVIEVAALSSAGNKTTPEQSPTFRRQRSFMRRKRFNGMGEATVQLRKEAAKSCSIM